jgi:acetyl esterase/lipase
VSRNRAVFPSLLLAAGLAGLAWGQAGNSQAVEKQSQVGVWKPTAGGTQIPLWPSNTDLARPDTGDRPEETGNGSTLVAKRKWHWASYVTRPTMTIYRPKGRNTGTTILVLPGGGFAALAMDLEGTEICEWAVGKGMTCVIVKYRAPQLWPMDEQTGRRRRPQPLLALQDAQRAMALLRQRGSAFGINPGRIGVIGFSAGAYVAAEMSNIEDRTYTLVEGADQNSSRPDFAIIAYTGRIWETSDAKTGLGLAPWVKISAKAPPTLLIHSMSDPSNDVRHSIAYALALGEAGVPVDLRLYSKGGHAFGMRPTDDPITRHWPGQAEQWLRDLGML